ncbi:hypothetical protein ACJ2_40210 [Pantoea sp. QMID2]|nr:hypothetical protein ACJ3_40120 [Pantoea sp. QMID3]GME63032.1 hypothetical protein ACJ2_40210 [Pantoea sp. QMID2]
MIVHSVTHARKNKKIYFPRLIKALQTKADKNNPVQTRFTLIFSSGDVYDYYTASGIDFLTACNVTDCAGDYFFISDFGLSIPF